MADVFISYKKEDRVLAKELANKLIELGWAVWWDRNIPIGKAYDQVIEEELAKTKCVIVLWSSLSITSLNVKEEALEGLRRNVLIPIAIGNVSPPYGFKMIQTMSWNKNSQLEEEELEELIIQVQRLIGNPPAGERKTIPKNISDKDVPEKKLYSNTDEASVIQKQSQLATLRFIRQNNWMGIWASIKIYINGERVGKLSIDETFTVSVNPGKHHLRVSGGGAFFDAEEKFEISSNEILSWGVGYLITGGIKLLRI